MFRNLIIIVLLLPVCVWAQNAVTGKVISMVNNKPVANASVFLGSSSVGGTSDTEGRFTLNNVKSGQYELVVSRIGYEAYHQIIFAGNGTLNIPEIKLMPKVTVLKEVKIKYDPSRDLRIRLFLQKLLGETENAQQCKVLNPEIINLDYKAGYMSATTDDFLLIENKALGYHVKLLLKQFNYNPTRANAYYSGSLVYEAMQGSDGQQRRWQKNRAAAYNGSVMHFLRACANNTIENEGFDVQTFVKVPNPNWYPDSLSSAKLKQFKAMAKDTSLADSILYWQERHDRGKFLLDMAKIPAREYIQRTDNKNVFAIAYPNYKNTQQHFLRIGYRNKPKYDSDITLFVSTAYFDSNGIFMSSKSNTLISYWSTQRIGDFLPIDYEVPKN
jgi:hypothetical protein